MAPPIPVIIDTDPGVDDVVALLLALASPELVVVGLTLTHGNCTLESTRDNLDKTFYALEQHLAHDPDLATRWNALTDSEWRRKSAGPGAETIKVWMGSPGPIHGAPVTAKYFHGQDGLANCETLYPDLTPPPSHRSNLYTLCPEPALEGVTRLVKSWRPDLPKPSYIALGPLTSLAQLSVPLDLGRSFETIVTMGGAVQHAGNTTPVAEFNYYADPWSARTVFGLSLDNLYMFPLDLTSYLTLPFALYASLVDPDLDRSPNEDASSSSSSSSRSQSLLSSSHRDPLVRFTTGFLRGTSKVMESFGGSAMELHDPTVVFAMVERSRTRAGSRARQQRQRQRGTNGDCTTVDEIEHDNGDYHDDDDESESESESGGEFAPGWEWKRVDFEVECDGTLTRGMLVLDHRTSSKSLTSITSRTGETNRAVAIERIIEQQQGGSGGRGRDEGQVALDVPEVEARQVEKKKEEQEQDEGKGKDVRRKVSGARVVVTSPGSEVMRTELLRRVWGVGL